MRSSAFRNLLQSIVVSVIPVASFSGCSAGEDCYGSDGQREQFVTIDSSGSVVGMSTTSPIPADAGAGDPVSQDGGADAGPDGGTSDCMSKCMALFQFLNCGNETVRGCATVGRTSDGSVIRCDLDSHRVCVPKGAICGRRPAGLRRTAMSVEPPCAPLGRLLSEMAALEAASVPAFRVLARELEAHGAPRALRRAAERAALDEVRHARTMKELAELYGGGTIAARVRRPGTRTLVQIAVENCVEGCVRETFGALVATWQAREARDPALRRAMRAIARDEVRHAALAFRLAAWMGGRLDEKERALVELARKRALADLRRDLAEEPAPEWVTAAGVPTSGQARELLSRMAASLWATNRQVA